VIWGDKDPYVSPEIAPRQREAFPHAAVHMIENSGHWPFVDEEQKVVGLMRPFFERELSQRIALSVTPRRVVRGARTVFRVRALAGAQPVAGATVRIRVRRAVTGSDGRANVVVTPGRLGRLGVSARKPPLLKGTTAVSVRSR
jgi:hypothetical protein